MCQGKIQDNEVESNYFANNGLDGSDTLRSSRQRTIQTILEGQLRQHNKHRRRSKTQSKQSPSNCFIVQYREIMCCIFSQSGPGGELILNNLSWSDMGEYTCVVENSISRDTTSTFLYPMLPNA